MGQTNSETVDTEQLKRYLFAELGEAERDELDQKLFADDVLFHEAVNIENELVDLYARGELSGQELQRFERSLQQIPDRKEKVANAIALQAFIEEEKAASRAPVPPAPVRLPRWQKLTDFFWVRSPVLGPAMATLLLLITAASVFLFVDNRRKGEHLALLQNERQNIETIWQQRERELQGDLSNTSQQVSELRTELGNKDQERGELIASLSTEQQRIQQLEKELERLSNDNSIKPPHGVSGPPIAAIALDPTRLGNGDRMKTTKLGKSTKRLAINLSLPDSVKGDLPLSVHLNERILTQNILPRTGPDGKKSISVSIPSQDIRSGVNKLAVMNSEGKQVTEYAFDVDKP